MDWNYICYVLGKMNYNNEIVSGSFVILISKIIAIHLPECSVLLYMIEKLGKVDDDTICLVTPV